jgi:hypothetical protein
VSVRAIFADLSNAESDSKQPDVSFLPQKLYSMFRGFISFGLQSFEGETMLSNRQQFSLLCK